MSACLALSVGLPEALTGHCSHFAVKDKFTRPNHLSVARLIRKLRKPEQLQVCYEAGPTGYALAAIRA